MRVTEPAGAFGTGQGEDVSSCWKPRSWVRLTTVVSCQACQTLFHSHGSPSLLHLGYWHHQPPSTQGQSRVIPPPSSLTPHIHPLASPVSSQIAGFHSHLHLHSYHPGPSPVTSHLDYNSLLTASQLLLTSPRRRSPLSSNPPGAPITAGIKSLRPGTLWPLLAS